MSESGQVAIACLVGYLLGSIPFGVIIARAKGVDIMSKGSGNVGATNVYRTLGKGPGLTVFALDVLKGLLPAGGTYLLTDVQWIAFAAGMASIVGHSLSPWIGFKGGKGIATGLGALLGSTPAVALSAFGVFLVFLGATSYVSLASLLAAAVLAPFGYLYGDGLPLVYSYLGLAAFIVWRHRANIRRLLKGEEPKFSFAAKKAAVDDSPSNGVAPKQAESDSVNSTIEVQQP